MHKLSARDYSILVGNIVDHFDTALYGFLAPIFAQEFFPNSDPIVSLIMAYSVFATTIITRPLGSYIFGLIAQAHSPAMSLSYSLIGVGITTFILGFLPTYAQIGFFAPFTLIILRFFNGIFSAGEITIAKLYILSDKSDAQAFKNSYLYQTSVMIGIVLASCASTIILSHEETNQYWRVCFIIGGIAALCGYLLRIYKTEVLTLNMSAILKLYSIQGIKVLVANKVLLLRVAIVSGFSYMTYSIPFIVMNNLLPKFTDFSLADLMPSNNWLLVMDMIALPFAGICLARFSPKNILFYSAMILAISILPIWYFTNNASFSYIIFIKIWIIVIGIAFSCAINLWLNNLISTEEKYLITGIGNAIGSAVIGKMAPAICLTVYYYTGSYLAIGWFTLITSCLTVLAIIVS